MRLPLKLSTAAVVLVFFANSTFALTQQQFADICATHPGDCGEHQVLQAYVGGALDLLATLDEQTDYLARMYCGEPAELFDVPKIIRYIEQHGSDDPDNNAMLGMVRYLEAEGECPRV